jgi:hypothetical protein
MCVCAHAIAVEIRNGTLPVVLPLQQTHHTLLTALPWSPHHSNELSVKFSISLHTKAPLLSANKHRLLKISHGVKQ